MKSTTLGVVLIIAVVAPAYCQPERFYNWTEEKVNGGFMFEEVS
jgi:hypothetical protein